MRRPIDGRVGTLLSWHVARDRDLAWLRVLGFGLKVTNREPLFSERNGYARGFRLGLGWRLTIDPRRQR